MKSICHRIGATCLTILAGTIIAAEPVKPLVDVTATTAQDARNAMKTFKFEAGLKIDLFAAEPLVANPVAFTVDAKGRWYIAETFRQGKGVEDNRGHNEWLAADIAARTIEDRLAMIRKFYPDAKKFAEKFTDFEDRVTRLEDSNGDGFVDQQTIYADGFRDPLDGTGAGILARGNDVWWTCIPHLWRFRDADGDGKAEVKDKLLTGFGVKYAFRGHDMHGLRFGPDGKLYFSIGDRGINVKSREGVQFSEPDTGTIMRCNVDGTGFEIYATGVRNPQELAFDEFGNLFTGDNNSDAGDQARFVHLVEGGDCGWRMTFQYLNDRGPWNREKLWDEKEALNAKYLIPPIANIGNGPSGLTYNPGTALGERHRGWFFLSDFRGGAGASVVHQIGLEPAGAWFKVKEVKPFIGGVLTTDCEFGNDGALYILDWVESWSGVGKGRIYKVSDPSADLALQAQTAKLIGEGMSQRKADELIKLLAHADMRIRQEAQFALAEKGERAGLGKLAADTKAKQLARIHAIWGLGQIAEKTPAAATPLVALLGDGDGEVRAQAAKVLGERKVTAAADKLVALLKDPAPRARFFAAISLGKLAYPPAVEPLFQMLAENNDRDPILRHGGVMGLKSCAKPGQLSAKSGDASVAVKIGAVLALRRQLSPEISVFLKDADEGVVLEAARAIYDMPVAGAMPALAALSNNSNLKNPRILERVLNANYRLGTADNARALATFASQASAPEASRKEALDALANWASPGPQDRLLNLWRPLPDRPVSDAVTAIGSMVPQLLKEGPGAVQEMTARLAAKLSINAGEALGVLATDEKAPTPARIAALQTLVTTKDPHLAEAAKSAFAAKDPKLRSEGLQAIAGLDPGTAVQFIGEILNSGTPVEKQGAINALAQNKLPQATALLAGLLDSLIAGEAAPEIQVEILETAKKNGAGPIKEKLAKYEESLKGADPLAAYKVALMGGNADRGRKIFRDKVEVQCLRCHKCETGDSLVGPDLTNIGAEKDRNYLLESIVFPNKTTAQGFGIVSLTLKDESNVIGRVLSEDATTIKVETLDAQGKPQAVSVIAANVKERVSAMSPMPENIRDVLSKSELRDLIEYLANRK